MVVDEYVPRVLSTVNASSEYFGAVREGMLMASLYGSASYVFGKYGVKVASKTGTAQVSEDDENNAVFIAFAPYEDPEIAVAVVVEKGAAGWRLAEIAREIFDCYFSETGAKRRKRKIFFCLSLYRLSSSCIILSQVGRSPWPASLSMAKLQKMEGRKAKPGSRPCDSLRQGRDRENDVAAALASCLASLGRPTLCVDADAGLKNLDLCLGLSNSAVYDYGDVLAGRCSLEAAVVVHPGYTVPVIS
jgi:hypothetical protein